MLRPADGQEIRVPRDSRALVARRVMENKPYSAMPAGRILILLLFVANFIHRAMHELPHGLPLVECGPFSLRAAQANLVRQLHNSVEVARQDRSLW